MGAAGLCVFSINRRRNPEDPSGFARDILVTALKKGDNFDLHYFFIDLVYFY